MEQQEERRSKSSLMTDAYARYRQRWGDWEPGMLRSRYRHGRVEFYYLPRWVDNWETLGLHLWARACGRCVTCHMKGTHKLQCYARPTLADDLRTVGLWPRKKAL